MEIPSTAVAAGRADVRICVAVCTCDRHEQLRGTLQSLVNQSIGARFCVFVVDNGRVAARPVVEAFENVLDIVHERVREPGLSAVRNRALHLARESGADFLASIDDDECADKDWLAAHLAAAELSGADIQIGPIEPRFVERPAGWIVAGGFFAEACETPTTANLFLRLACLPQSEGDWFQPDYAVTGGEDHEFLGRLSSNGARYGVVSSARVYDIVPAERATLRYILRRGLRGRRLFRKSCAQGKCHACRRSGGGSARVSGETRLRGQSPVLVAACRLARAACRRRPGGGRRHPCRPVGHEAPVLRTWRNGGLSPKPRH